jgi:hypothetical protein
MNDQTEQEQTKVGIAGLPKQWAVAVQLIGTFGLAVFLVLYYLFFMYPRETARYENLQKSVEGLMAVVEKQQTLLQGPQADSLEVLFVSAVAGEFCVRTVRAMREGTEAAELARSLDDALMMQVDRLQGLTRKDGRQVSEMLANKIRESRLSVAFANEAPRRWQDAEPIEMLQDCEGFLHERLGRLRRAK